MVSGVEEFSLHEIFTDFCKGFFFRLAWLVTKIE